MKKKLFEQYGTEKSFRLIICQSSMALWYSLQALSISGIERRSVTRNEYKEIVRSYPLSTNGCKCRCCRYNRLANRGSK